MKICSSCKIQKPFSEFAGDKHRPDGFTCQCKECIRVAKRKYRKTEKGKATEKRYQQSKKGKLARKQIDLKYNYGITLEEHKQMYADQDGKCLICGKQITYTDVCTDHNHLTGEVRGLLCKSCNSRLGWFENRREQILNYLK